jgi:hypothetical protein
MKKAQKRKKAFDFSLLATDNVSCGFLSLLKDRVAWHDRIEICDWRRKTGMFFRRRQGLNNNATIMIQSNSQNDAILIFNKRHHLQLVSHVFLLKPFSNHACIFSTY